MTAAEPPRTGGAGAVRRPPVTIVVPFSGRAAELAQVVTAFRSVVLTSLDAVAIVDNSPRALPLPVLPPKIRIVRAGKEGSSYYARNVGAGEAQSEWILFVDADCIPAENLVDEYFLSALDEYVGAVAGDIVPSPAHGLIGRYAASRRLLDPYIAFARAFGAPVAHTANLLVRKRAFDAVGGFVEGIRSGGDYDFALRLQAAGWTVRLNLNAAVQHRHRESLGALITQFRRYGGGEPWLHRRHGAPAAWRISSRRAARGLLFGAASAARRDWEGVVFGGLDLVAAGAEFIGSFEGNQPSWRSSSTR